MEPDPSIGRAPQLGDYAAVLRARKWLVISVTLLSLVGAGTYLALRTPVYRSEAEVQIFVTDEGLGTAVDLGTEVRIAASLAVADFARLRSLRNDFASAEELQDHVSVSLPTEAAILLITFTDTDRDLAGRGAAAMQEAYLAFKTDQLKQRVDTERANLQEREQTLLTEFSTLQAILEDPNASESQKAAASIEQTGVQGDLDEIGGRLSELANDQPTVGLTLGPPTIPRIASPGLPIVLGGAGVLGLFLGSILAFIVEGLTGRVREAEEVEEELGAAVLGMVPIMHLKRTRGRVPVVSRDSPSEPAAEAYRLLRSGFLYAAGSDERVVMVTSPGVGDGKSTTAANLAVALAQAGHKTVLIGGDLRRSDLHTLFGVPNDTGLVHVLEGRSRPAPLPTDVENLRIVPSGPPTDISAHLFETEAFPEALAILREQAEYVVVDAPPLAISDPLLMVPAVDYVIFVVDANKATRRALRRTRELLQRIGLPRMGVVLNRSKSPWGPSGTRAYYYYKKGKSAEVPAAAPKEPVAVAAKPVESKPVPVEKPAASKPVESRPVTYEAPPESKPVAAEAPVESKPVEPKPVEPAKAAAPTPAEPAAAEEPTEAKPAEPKPVEPKPVALKPVALKPVASDKVVASKPPEPIAAESPAPAASKANTAEKPTESKPMVSQPPSGAGKPDESKPVEVKPLAAMPKPAASGPEAEETSKSKPETTPDATAKQAATPQTPAETAAAPDAAAVTSPVPGSPVTHAPVAPPAQQAPVEAGVKAEPAAVSAPPTAPEKAVEAVPAATEATPPAPPVPVESPPPVPPVPVAGTPVPQAAGTPPPVPATPPPAPESSGEQPSGEQPSGEQPSGEQAPEPAIETMPQPVVEPSSRNGGRASKRSGSRKRRSGNRGRSRPSGG